MPLKNGVMTTCAALLLAGCSASDGESAPVSYSASDYASKCASLIRDELHSYGVSYLYVDIPDSGVSPGATSATRSVNGIVSTAEDGRVPFTAECELGSSPEDNKLFDFRPADGSVDATDSTVSTRSTSARPVPTESDSPRSRVVADPPIQRNQIDPNNDPSGKTGADDNLGIYYHNSTDWKWLEQPGKIVPGGRIGNRTMNAMCSVGFIASYGERVFIVTAGHCGNQGDEIVVGDSAGNYIPAGEVVESYVEQGAGGAIVGTDIGLIELYPDVPVDSSLPVGLPLKGYITPQEAQSRNMAICRLGATTGYSCGKFEDIGNNGLFYYRSINDRGDSGGAVFAVDSDGVWGLGVSSNVADTNKTYAGAMEVASAMEHWGLTLHG